jgi:SAM-dependent methyltransferase
MTQRDLWNDRYSERGTLWGADPNVFVVDRLGQITPGRALDLGCGQGRNAIWLAAQGHTVTAVDVSDVAVAQAAEIAARAGVEVDFVAADLQTWEPPAAAFDLVLLAYIQAPPGIRETLHAKAIRALAPGGVLCVVAHHLDNLEDGVGGPPVPDVLFHETMLAADFAGLDVVENSRVLRRVDKEGVIGDAIDVVFMGRRVE